MKKQFVMKIDSQVNYYSNHAMTRRQLERALPQDTQVASLLQDTVGDSVEKMLGHIAAASERSKDKQMWGTIAAVGGTAVAVLAPTAPWISPRLRSTSGWLYS